MTGKNPPWLVIHGHFYQPPREDPWAGSIDHQDSARPWHDWNERINAECYAANTDARTLDPGGRITDIVNNYEFISFNFGPTLLSWLEREDPAAYAAILRADAVSRANNDGHGNAIAQVYNHMILPLANTRDKLTQIRWGLADFKARFGREAEGIWLAETAINGDTVEALISEGVKFVILSPTQAEAVRQPGTADWHDVANNGIDTSQAYRIATRHGELAVFFYDLDVSKSVGFEHLLTDAGRFRDRLLAAVRPDSPVAMVNIATDGESYGHHEPFANMCLGALIAENRQHGHFRLSNYGCFLAAHPPTAEVRLKAGNEGLGTAWSCAHGVGRWVEDCGCGGGGPAGWQQRWRGPLRAAFDLLRDELWTASLAATGGLISDFEAARDAYIDVILAGDDARPAFEAFLARFLVRPASEDERHLLRALFEAQKYALYMYTSCGWFFSEISGLEGVQCMRYAARAIDLAADWLPEDIEERVLEVLETAPSNIVHYGTGRRVWTELVRRYVLDGERVVNQFVIERLLSGGPARGRMYFYDIDLAEDAVRQGADGSWLASGIATVRDGMSWLVLDWFYFIRCVPPAGISVWVRQSGDTRLGAWLGEVFYETAPAELGRHMKEWIPRQLGLADLKFDRRRDVLGAIFAADFAALEDPAAVERLDVYLALIAAYGHYGVPLPGDARSSLETLCNRAIRQALSHEAKRFDFERVTRIFEASRSSGLELNRETVGRLFARQIRAGYENWIAECERAGSEAGAAVGACGELVAMLEFVNRSGLEFDRKWIENRAWADLHERVAPAIATARDAAFVRRMLHVAEMVNLQIFRWRQEADEVFGQEGD